MCSVLVPVPEGSNLQRAYICMTNFAYSPKLGSHYQVVHLEFLLSCANSGPTSQT